MAALVRARADLLSGALVLLNDEFSVNNEGRLNYNARYCCLEQYAATHAPSFKVGSNPPTPRSSKLSQEYSMTNLPLLVDVQTLTENGIVYFDTSFASIALVNTSGLSASSSASASNPGTVGLVSGLPTGSGISGSQATDKVATISITNQGSGYVAKPSVEISGGGGSGASATANVSNGQISGLTITNGGSGYSSPPTVTISGGGGNGATATSTLTNGQVTGLTVTSSGSGYSSGPNVSFSGGGGSGAAATANVADGKITGVTVTNGGSGYTSAPTVTISGGNGSGATASSNLGASGSTIRTGSTQPVDSSAIVPNINALNVNQLSGEASATISTEQRSFSGSFQYVDTQGTFNTFYTINYSFDYTSTSITTETINQGTPSYNFPSSSVLVSEPFNLRIEAPSNISVVQLSLSLKNSYSKDCIVSTRATYTSGGKQSVSITVSGIYVSA